MQTVIGAGEVGLAVGQVLDDLGNRVEWSDPKLPADLPAATVGKVSEALHICIPYGPSFVDHVQEHFRNHPTKAVIVHSTVKPGTCQLLANVLCETAKEFDWPIPGVVFSPIRGSHRSNGGLRPAIHRLVKYYAPVDDPGFGRYGEAEAIFLRSFRGLILKAFPDVRSLEFAKVMSTTYFGWAIAFEKRMHDACVKHGFDFDAAYTDWNETYNAGMPEQFRRPVLKHMEGVIGGHCIIPNLALLLDDVTEDVIDGLASIYDEIILWG